MNPQELKEMIQNKSYSKLVSSFEGRDSLQLYEALPYSYALIELRRFSEAEKILRTLIRENPGVKEAKLNYSLLLMRQERWQDTGIFLRSVWQEDVRLACNYGICLSQFKEYDKARTVFETCVKASPEWCEPKVNLAITYYSLKMLEHAKKTIDEAEGLEPQNRRIKAVKRLIKKADQEESLYQSSLKNK